MRSLEANTADIFPAPRPPLAYKRVDADECEVDKIANVLHMYEGDDSTTDLTPTVEKVKDEIGFKPGNALPVGLDSMYLLRRGYRLHELLPPGCFSIEDFYNNGADYFREFYKESGEEFTEYWTDERIEAHRKTFNTAVNTESMPGFSKEQTNLTGARAVHELLKNGYVADLTMSDTISNCHNVLITGLKFNEEYIAENVSFEKLLNESYFRQVDPANWFKSLTYAFGFMLDSAIEPRTGIIGIRKDA